MTDMQFAHAVMLCGLAGMAFEHWLGGSIIAALGFILAFSWNPARRKVAP